MVACTVCFVLDIHQNAETVANKSRMDLSLPSALRCPPTFWPRDNRRCSMINIDPETGDTSGIALKVLAGYRRERASILFGQFLAWDPMPLPSPAGTQAGDGEGGEHELATVPEGGCRIGGETESRRPCGKQLGTGSEMEGCFGKKDSLPSHWRGVFDGQEEGDEKGAAAEAGGGGVVEVAEKETGDGPHGNGGWASWVSEGMEVDGEA